MVYKFDLGMMIAYKLINFDRTNWNDGKILIGNVTRAKLSFICPPIFFLYSPGTVLVVKRRRSSVCRLAPEGSTLLYVCMHMYLCMYVYVPMYVVPGGCTKVRYLMTACQVKISSPVYSTCESIFVLQRKLYLLQIREEKLKPLTNEPKISI